MTKTLNQMFSLEDIKLISVKESNQNLIIDPNIHLNRKANILIKENGLYSFKNANFGFLTRHDYKATKNRLNTHNARIENLTKSELWSPAFLNKHCLVPVSGFYAWVSNHPQNIPYLYSLKDSAVTYLAGLYNYNENFNVYSFAIVTCDNISSKREKLERMPLVVRRENACDWLDNGMNDNLLPDYCMLKLEEKLVSRRIKNPQIKNLEQLYHVG